MFNAPLLLFSMSQVHAVIQWLSIKTAQHIILWKPHLLEGKTISTTICNQCLKTLDFSMSKDDFSTLCLQEKKSYSTKLSIVGLSLCTISFPCLFWRNDPTGRPEVNLYSLFGQISNYNFFMTVRIPQFPMSSCWCLTSCLHFCPLKSSVFQISSF